MFAVRATDEYQPGGHRAHANLGGFNRPVFQPPRNDTFNCLHFRRSPLAQVWPGCRCPFQFRSYLPTTGARSPVVTSALNGRARDEEEVRARGREPYDGAEFRSSAAARLPSRTAAPPRLLAAALPLRTEAVARAGGGSPRAGKHGRASLRASRVSPGSLPPWECRSEADVPAPTLIPLSEGDRTRVSPANVRFCNRPRLT